MLSRNPGQCLPSPDTKAIRLLSMAVCKGDMLLAQRLNDITQAKSEDDKE
jgi:hypothetical protein